MRSARGVAVLLLALTFVVGALGGMALEEGLGLDWFDFLDSDEHADERLFAGMDLTREQEARIDAVMDAREDRLEAYWESRLPEIAAIVDRSYAEARAVLTPEQRAVFDRRVRERGPADVRDED